MVFFLSDVLCPRKSLPMQNCASGLISALHKNMSFLLLQFSRATTKDGIVGRTYRNAGCRLYRIKLIALSFPEERCRQFLLKYFKMQQS